MIRAFETKEERQRRLEYHKNYNRTHREIILRQMKEWQMTHPEYKENFKKWIKIHKEEYNTWRREYRKKRKDARFKNVIHNFTFLYKDEILRRDNYICQKCGAKENLELHHKKYTHDLNDVITLCKKCHLKLRPKKYKKEN